MTFSFRLQVSVCGLRLLTYAIQLLSEHHRIPRIRRGCLSFKSLAISSVVLQITRQFDPPPRRFAADEPTLAGRFKPLFLQHRSRLDRWDRYTFRYIDDLTTLFCRGPNLV